MFGMSERPGIVCTDVECRFEENDLHRLRAVGDVAVCDDLQIPTLCHAVREADVLVASCFSRVPQQVIAAGRRLKAIVKYGVGVDNIDVAAAGRHGVIVANCPDYGSGTVAEHAWALLMDLARKIALVDRQMRCDGWLWPQARWCGMEITGKTIGIVGLGRIGREFAKRARGFDVRLLAHDPLVAPQVFEACGCEAAALDELLAESDFVSLHCTLTDHTRGLIDAAALARMKATAYLINVSRGLLVEFEALLAALEGKRIAGAGLDVFAVEPLRPDHPLLGLDNVVISPHFAWYTAEAARRQSRQAAEAVLDVLAGRLPRGLVGEQGLVGERRLVGES